MNVSTPLCARISAFHSTTSPYDLVHRDIGSNRCRSAIESMIPCRTNDTEMPSEIRKSNNSNEQPNNVKERSSQIGRWSPMYIVYVCCGKSGTPNRILMPLTVHFFAFISLAHLSASRSCQHRWRSALLHSLMYSIHVCERCRGDGQSSNTVYCTFCFSKDKKTKKKKKWYQ